MSTEVDLFKQASREALRAEHPEFLYFNRHMQLKTYPDAMTTIRVARQLVASTQKFDNDMRKSAGRIKDARDTWDVIDKMVECSFCGSTLCEHYANVKVVIVAF